MTVYFNQRDTIWAPPNKAVDSNGGVHGTIQGAVDNTNGMILVGPGTFEESVSIPDTSDLTGGSIIGVGQATLISGGADHGLDIRADDFLVSTLAVQTTGGGGNGADGINISDASDPRIESVTVLDSDRDGIAATGCTGGWVTNCNVEVSDRHGISFASDRGRVGGNYVGEMSNDIGGDGIVLNQPETICHDNFVFAPTDAGIRATNSDQSISGNTITQCQTGITLTGTDQRVGENTFVDISGSDIDASGATTPRLRETDPEFDSISVTRVEETVVTANTGAAYEIDVDSGSVFNLTLTDSVTFSFANAGLSTGANSVTLILTQDGTGSRTATWPASVQWEGGTSPTLSTAASATDVVTLTTPDDGTTWFGFLSGSDFS